MFMQRCLFDGRQSTQFFPDLEHEQFLHLPLPLHRQQTGMVQASGELIKRTKKIARVNKESTKSARSTFRDINVSYLFAPYDIYIAEFLVVQILLRVLLYD